MSQAPNLTRAQAGERSKTISTTSYDIAVDVTDGAGGPGEKTFGTTTLVRFDAEPGSSTFIDFVGGVGVGAKRHPDRYRPSPAPA